jgi:hypothetical protein
MGNGFVEKLERYQIMAVLTVESFAHSNDRHSKNPELKGNKNNILAFGVLESAWLVRGSTLRTL